jgi:hypothetical protein
MHSVLPKADSTADISWPPPPLQKQSVRAVVLRVPKAVAGASGAYQVAVGKRYQAVYTLYHLHKQLSSREMAWQPQISSAQASTRSICSAGRGSWADNLGLRHHGRTSIIVPEIDH